VQRSSHDTESRPYMHGRCVCGGGGGGSVGREDGHREVREDKHGEADHEEEEGCMAV
jgi:hypothetical protein